MTIDVQLRQIRSDIQTWAEKCDGITPTKRQGNECNINAVDEHGYPQGGGPGVGDSVLFSAILYYSGETWAGESVRRSQGEDGRMWRSPQRVERDTEPTFSRDHLLGVLLYMVVCKNRGRQHEAIRFGTKLWDYVAQKRCNELQKAVNQVNDATILLNLVRDPITTLDTILGASVPSRYRLCGGPDDYCSISLIPYGYWGRLMLEVWRYVGVPLSTTKSIEVKIPISFVPDFSHPIEFSLSEYAGFDYHLMFIEQNLAVAFGSAYHDHLSVVAAIILREIGLADNSCEAQIQKIAQRNPNPFFLWTAGKNSEAKEAIIQMQPPNPQPPHKRTQWSWERDYASKAWFDTFGWDFVAVINLLLGDISG